MRTLIYLDDARDDLQRIVDHIHEAGGSLATATRFADLLVAHCERLARLSGTLGRPRDELSVGLRSLVFRRYLIFFMYAPGAVIIVNILHASRDIDAFFTEGP